MEMQWDRLDVRDTSKCGACGICTRYCPLDIELPAGLNSEECIKCLYCFVVCPEQAIEFKGRLGFMEKHLKKYAKIIKKLS
jgi:ferredoxin